MSLDTAILPTDPEALRAFALACQAELVVANGKLGATTAELNTTTAELRAARAAVQFTRLEIEKLKMQLAKLRRMQFGQSSERLNRQIEQLELQLEELEATEALAEAQAEASGQVSARPERMKPKRRPLPDHLPRQDILHEPADACTCSACGAGMSKLGEDVTEVLDYVPGRFQGMRHVRPKYACKRCDRITQAPAPALPIPRGRPSPALLAHVLVAKYCDHLPLYRQSVIYARDGLDLDRSTLADWVGQAAWLLDPVVEAIRAHVFAAEKIHGDDTPVPVLAPGTGKAKIGRLWVYARDDRPFCGTAPPAAAFFIARTARASDRTSICRALPASSRPTPMPGMRRSMIPTGQCPVRSSRSVAGRTAVGSISTCGRRPSRRSRRKRSTGSQPSMRSRPRRAESLPTNASRSGQRLSR